MLTFIVGLRTRQYRPSISSRIYNCAPLPLRLIITLLYPTCVTITASSVKRNSNRSSTKTSRMKLLRTLATSHPSVCTLGVFSSPSIRSSQFQVIFSKQIDKPSSRDVYADTENSIERPPAGTAFDPQSDGSHPPKLFQPLKLRGVTFQNRIMV